MLFSVPLSLSITRCVGLLAVLTFFPHRWFVFLAFWGYFRVWNIENFHIFFFLWRLPLLCACYRMIFRSGYFLFHFLFQYIIIRNNFFFRVFLLSSILSRTHFKLEKLYLRIKRLFHMQYWSGNYAAMNRIHSKLDSSIKPHILILRLRSIETNWNLWWKKTIKILIKMLFIRDLIHARINSIKFIFRAKIIFDSKMH